MRAKALIPVERFRSIQERRALMREAREFALALAIRDYERRAIEALEEIETARRRLNLALQVLGETR